MEELVLKTALDIGSSKVKLILGELSGDGEKIRIIGSSEVTSTGVRKSMVENVESLSDSIRQAVYNLEEKTGASVKKTSIGIGGNHLRSITKNIRFNLPEEEEEVSKEHYKNLFTLAEQEVITNESIIKKEIYNIRIDDSGILKNPVGMMGNTLEGDVHLITADKSQLELLVEAVNRAGLEVEEITLNSYASAQAILNDQDKKMGVALVDIGEGSTDLIIFKNDKLIYSKSIPVGGMHYINDIAYIFKLEREKALELKEIYIKNKTEDVVRMNVEDELREFEVSHIRKIFDARSGDIINCLEKALEESGFKGYLGNGIILTGGVVGMDEMVEELAKNLNYKVKVGTPIKLRGMSQAAPSYSTALGILLEVLEKEHFKIKNPVKAEVKVEVKKDEIEKKQEPKVVKEKEKKEDAPKVKKEGYFQSFKKLMKEFI